MSKPIFQGVCTAMVTPFHNNTVNYAMLEQLLLRQRAAGVGAVVLCGTTGEAPTLSHKEQMKIFRQGRNILKRDAVIIAGTGSNDTVKAVSSSQAAEDMGVDAVLVVTPYYNKATESGLIAHYTAIADAVHIPVILYNVPSRTGVNIPVSVYRILAQHPNICGVKEASGDLGKIARIRNECGQDFSIWSGNDELAIGTMALGGQGVISVLSNLYPAAVSEMLNAALEGNFAKAGAMQCKLMPITDALFSAVNPIPIKAAMAMIGYEVGSCRLPLTELNQTQMKNLQRLIESMDIVEP